jgi:hypothetical protein
LSKNAGSGSVLNQSGSTTLHCLIRNNTLDGQIQLILGPMFSGKSTELMRRLKRYQVAQYKVLIVKYAKVNILKHVIFL